MIPARFCQKPSLSIGSPRCADLRIRWALWRQASSLREQAGRHQSISPIATRTCGRPIYSVGNGTRAVISNVGFQKQRTIPWQARTSTLFRSRAPFCASCPSAALPRGGALPPLLAAEAEFHQRMGRPSRPAALAPHQCARLRPHRG